MVLLINVDYGWPVVCLTNVEITPHSGPRRFRSRFPKIHIAIYSVVQCNLVIAILWSLCNCIAIERLSLYKEDYSALPKGAQLTLFEVL